METGNYKKKINFDLFLAQSFSPHLYSSEWAHVYGCGCTALVTLTGVNPNAIKYRSTWEDDFMISFLKKRKWLVQKLTKHNICNRAGIAGPIKRNHIILASLLLRKKEASWMIIYDNYCFHNFEICVLKPYDFMNMPILTAYLVIPASATNLPEGAGVDK